MVNSATKLKAVPAPARPGAPLPRVLPMLAMPGRLPADESDWGFEFKWDGVRALVYWDGASLRIEARSGSKIADRYPELHPLGPALGKSSAILDGEVIALDDAGRPSFAALQRRMHVLDPAAVARLIRSVPVSLVLFDVLYHKGRLITAQPYAARRRLLERMVPAGDAWQITPMQIGQGERMLSVVRDMQMEGVVAKRLSSTYQPGVRSADWIKIKVIREQEFVVGGYVPEAGTRDGTRIGSILLGYYDSGRLRYAGRVGTGFKEADHRLLAGRLTLLARERNPFDAPVPGDGVQFVEPKLVAEVEYRRWPVGSRVQQAAYKGLRDDKDPRSVVKE